jgi:hypothetical protein
LTQQIKYHEQRLAIGNVTQADFISETVSLMEGVAPVEAAEATPSEPPPKAKGEAVPVSSPEPSARDRLREAWVAFKEELRILLRRTWIVLRDWAMSISTPDARLISGNTTQSGS